MPAARPTHKLPDKLAEKKAKHEERLRLRVGERGAKIPELLNADERREREQLKTDVAEEVTAAIKDGQLDQAEFLVHLLRDDFWEIAPTKKELVKETPIFETQEGEPPIPKEVTDIVTRHVERLESMVSQSAHLHPGFFLAGTAGLKRCGIQPGEKLTCWLSRREIKDYLTFCMAGMRRHERVSYIAYGLDALTNAKELGLPIDMHELSDILKKTEPALILKMRSGEGYFFEIFALVDCLERLGLSKRFAKLTEASKKRLSEDKDLDRGINYYQSNNTERLDAAALMDGLVAKYCEKPTTPWSSERWHKLLGQLEHAAQTNEFMDVLDIANASRYITIED